MQSSDSAHHGAPQPLITPRVEQSAPAAMASTDEAWNKQMARSLCIALVGMLAFMFAWFAGNYALSEFTLARVSAMALLLVFANWRGCMKPWRELQRLRLIKQGVKAGNQDAINELRDIQLGYGVRLPMTAPSPFHTIIPILILCFLFWDLVRDDELLPKEAPGVVVTVP